MNRSIACNVLRILRHHQRERVAGRFRAARAADAMNVIFRMLRHVVVDHVADVRDVQARAPRCPSPPALQSARRENPCSACSRSRWVRLECSTATA